MGKKSKTLLIEEISEELGLKKRNCFNIINKFKNEETLERKKGSGRKRKTTKREDNLIKKKNSK